MTRTMTATKAKAELASCIRLARHGETIVITNHGRPVAAIVSTDELEKLERLRAAGPQDGLVSLAGGWDGSTQLKERAMAQLRSPEAIAQPSHDVLPSGSAGADSHMLAAATHDAESTNGRQNELDS